NRSQELAELQGILGGTPPLEALVATAILLAKNAGFIRAEGIKDGAQIARAELSETRPGGFYDLYFRKFGFHPPEAGQDYWSLSLRDFNVYRRKSGAPTESQPSPLREIEQDVPQSIGRYFYEVLQRAHRDATGGRLRSRDWDIAEPMRASQPVRAFWKFLAPALSGMNWQYTELSPIQASKSGNPSPFQLRNLATSERPVPPFFHQAVWSAENQPSPLDPAHLELFRRILRGGASGAVR